MNDYVISTSKIHGLAAEFEGGEFYLRSLQLPCAVVIVVVTC